MEVSTLKNNLSINIIDLKNIEGNLRIDAEYYQQYYYNLIDNLKKKTFSFLYDIANNQTGRFMPNKEGYFKYLEISNINTTNGDYIFEDVKNSEAPSRAQKILSKNNLVISMVRPNRNAVSLIFDDYDNMVASSGFCVLKNIKINPYYLFEIGRASCRERV